MWEACYQRCRDMWVARCLVNADSMGSWVARCLSRVVTCRNHVTRRCAEMHEM
eukprot:jgi/Mesvir1/20883/Mv26443-RA.1